MSEPQEVEIEIISDVVCPWCYIGLAHLRQAIAWLEGQQPGSSTRLRVRWSPYMLNPRMPESGMPRRDYLVAKFGQAGLAGYAQIADHARAAGLPMNLDAIPVQPNTLAAHVLIAAMGDEATTLVDQLFQAFFVDGRNLADQAVLLDCAEAAGLSAERAQAALADTMLVKRVSHIAEEWVDHGVNGVPTFRLKSGSSERLINGAAAPSVLGQTLLQMMQP
ncbi:MAG: DsbA family oxidoreductase [Burkholderiaceae bacterium]